MLSSILICPLARTQQDWQYQAAEIKYTSHNFPDPFRSIFEKEELPLETKPVKTDLPNLQVQGIVWGSAMPQAIINNRVVKIGEVIGGAKILDIRKDGVYVLFETESYILRPKTP